MKEKRISVVIPTYNRQALLLECLQALQRQNLGKCDFEVIVVHDGPYLNNDLSELSGRDFGYRLYLKHTDVKKGPAAARNLGWLHARHALVAFTDDDCLPDEGWLTQLLAAYNLEDKIAFSGQTKVPLPTQPSDFERNTAGLETAEFITANCACTKQALTEVGGFDERFGLAWREDSDLEFKLIQSEIPIRKISTALVVHPVRAATWGISLKEQKKGLYDVLLFKKYPQLYREKAHNPIWNYYLVISLTLLMVGSAIAGSELFTKICALLLLFLLGSFFYKRIKTTRKSAGHITEMLITSMLIPFLSVFWRGYGMLKYKKILL